MADKPAQPASGPDQPGDSVEAREAAARIAEARASEELGKALEREAAEAEAAATAVPGLGGEGRLKLDKSGALIGIEKLKPVRAHGRAEGAPPAPGAAAAAPAPAPAARVTAPAAATPAPAATLAPAAAPAPAPQPGAAPPPGAPRRAVLPPRIGAYVPPGFPGSSEGGNEIEIPAGAFIYGEDRQTRTLPAFRIDRLPVTHAEYERFVRETGHRPPLYWPAGHLPEDLRDHPVVGVDYFDALAYARWAGKDLPFEDEWERAARGTDGRTWPWGDAGDLPASNTARTGYKMTLPVGFFPENESPDGVKDLVGNVWEITHSPAPGGGVVVRGGSWFDFAFHAKTWFRFAARPTARNGTIGFRCVRRSAPRNEGPRGDAPREVDPGVVEAEIAARRGPQAPIDPSQFSADRRDLVPDIRRLRVLLAEKQVTEAVGAAARSPVPPPAAAKPPPAPPPPRAAPPPPVVASALQPEAPQVVTTASQVGVPQPASTPTASEVQTSAGPTQVAHTPAPEKEGPLHVLLQTGSAASNAAAAAAEVARLAPPPPPPPPPEPPAPAPTLEQLAAQKTPAALWALLAVGFALLIGLLVWLVTSGQRGDEPAPKPEVPGPEQPGPGPGPQTPEPEEPSELPPEPQRGQAALDGQPGRILDGTSGTWRERLGAGAWLLVFAGGTDDVAAASTRASALSLHRRYLGSGLNVALVVPRTRVERGDGTLIEPFQLDAALVDLSVRDGITVLLDPRQDQRDAIRESRFGLTTPNAALLLVEGQVEVLTQPPEGPMTLKHLGRIAERARAFLR